MTTVEYLQYILDVLSDENVTYRAMMGEYILYYKGKVVGGLYDDRLLVKPTPSAKALLAGAPSALPYEGAKPMLLVTETDDGDLLRAVLAAVWQDLFGPRN